MGVASSPLWTAGIVLLVALSLGIALGPSILRHFREKRLLRTGVEAPARVEDLVDTGNRYNSNPQVIMKLTVLPEGAEPFPAELRIVLSPVDIPKFPAGTTVRVRYDPEDRTSVALVR